MKFTADKMRIEQKGAASVWMHSHCGSSVSNAEAQLSVGITFRILPTFATGRSKSPKPLIFCGGRWLGRHHSAGCHSDLATSAAVTLGGGWAGKLIFNRWSRMA